ncbi:YcnI family protein [Microbacterium gilvum]|uniref:YncI copper-binding domain-containing protein n=1 Tax=Microbacterium gilvum TaxID=1336204 RepID=A0ABP9AFC5_9MICO
MSFTPAHLNTAPVSPAPRIRRRRAIRLAAGAAAACALVVAAPLAAQAHVTVTPDAPVAGGYDVLTFAFSHGCDESPTTQLVISMPDEGLDSATPTIQAGWTIDVARDASTGLVDTITYTADEPVPNAMRAAVEISVAYAADAPETLAFPVEQICEDGSTSWSEIAEDGEDPHALDAPAPVVTLAESGDTATTDETSHADHETASATASAAADADPLPVALGAGGLVAGVAALVVAVLAYRRGARR